MKKLKFYQIAFIYIGCIMGAGFASGRECWQFFGIFGSKSYYSAIVMVIVYSIISLMLCYISRSKQSSNYTELISPIDNSFINKLIRISIGMQYFIVQIAMTAAGGSLLNQQFGISKVVGGLVIVFLELLTVLGDFDRISKVFTKVEPFLFATVIITAILVIKSDFAQSGPINGYDSSGLTPNYIVSAFLFMAYNTIAMVTVVGSTSLYAKNAKHAYWGSLSGALCLGFLIIVVLKALLTDMQFTDSADLPMLAYSSRLSVGLNIVFAIVLYGAIYSAASSTLFGFANSIPQFKHHKTCLMVTPFICFLLSLVGFTKLIEYIYPILGYISIILVILIICNFIKVYHNNIEISGKPDDRVT